MDYQPVCATCGTNMSCRKNGFYVLRNSGGKTVAISIGDKYGCNECGAEVVVDFSDPIPVGDRDFDQYLRIALELDHAVVRED